MNIAEINTKKCNYIYKDYSIFIPQKYQSCIVRDSSCDVWKVSVCKGLDLYDIPIFYSGYWSCYLQLDEVTEQLVGTTKSYEERIEELNKN